MALCVRRLRGAPGLGGRWTNGVRGAGGAAGRHREVSRVHDAILFRELNPYPGIRMPVPPTAIVLSPRTKPMDIRRPSPTSERERALLQIKDIINQNKLAPKPVSQFLHNAEPCACHPFISECGYLSSAQLDCFRRLFDPAVCRTPFHAMSFPTPPAQEGLLEFTLSARSEGSEAPRSNQPSMEEHLAVMHEKLREELPKFLWKPANLTLYRKDMEFTSSIYNWHIRGVINYQLFLSLVKILLVSYYMNSQISILNLTSHLETNSIHVRWSFSGIPLQNLFLLILKRSKSEVLRTYDFFSTFQLAPDGLICLHKLEQVMPSPPLTISKKKLLTAALLALGLGEDRPALNLLSTPKLPDEL